jgi:glycosyltransferase involved in cell wall biosynthesis
LPRALDHIIVTDNGSQDGTKEILEQYQASGQITLIHEPPADFSQHRWVTRMARHAYDRFHADWVINADADELFVWPHGSLRDALERIPAKVHRLRALRTDFVPFNRPESQSALREMIYRKTKSLGRWAARFRRR